MAKKYFGTDGIRGAVNSKNINGDMFFKFGLASGTYFKTQKKKKQIAIIAKDTRLSGYTLEPALVSGLTAAGMHVYTLGPLPTNGLAMLTKTMKANMGIMITASHNPYYDNGLKLFGPDGLKLSDKIEKKIESLIDKKIKNNLSEPKELGRVKRLESGNKDYIKILKKNFSKDFNLRGLRIVIDCANGAGYMVGPELLKSLYNLYLQFLTFLHDLIFLLLIKTFQFFDQLKFQFFFQSYLTALTHQVQIALAHCHDMDYEMP